MKTVIKTFFKIFNSGQKSIVKTRWSEAFTVIIIVGLDQENAFPDRVALKYLTL